MFQTARICDRGGRAQNQDDANFLILDEPRAGCWILADGLGGHRCGEIASRLAVDAVLNSFRHDPTCTPEALEAHFSAAQGAILAGQKSETQLAGMRSTLVVLITDLDYFLWGYIGDSRLYYFQDNRIVDQSRDHSVPQAMVDSGQIAIEQIRGHEDRNRLLRSLGNERDLRPTISKQKRRLYRGDAFLMCSDGFWECVYENEMEADITKAKTPQDWLGHLEHRLRRRARGQFDNYSAIGVYFTSLNAPRPSAPEPRQPPRKRVKRKKKELSVTLLVLALALLFSAGVVFLGYTSYKTWFAGPEKPGEEPGNDAGVREVVPGSDERSESPHSPEAVEPAEKPAASTTAPLPASQGTSAAPATEKPEGRENRRLRENTNPKPTTTVPENESAERRSVR